MSERTRDEHLAWAKKRALEYLDVGELENAFASMASDLSQHSELKQQNLYLQRLGLNYMANGDAAGLRRWIEGFR